MGSVWALSWLCISPVWVLSRVCVGSVLACLGSIYSHCQFYVSQVWILCRVSNVALMDLYGLCVGYLYGSV